MTKEATVHQGPSHPGLWVSFDGPLGGIRSNMIRRLKDHLTGEGYNVVRDSHEERLRDINRPPRGLERETETEIALRQVSYPKPGRTEATAEVRLFLDLAQRATATANRVEPSLQEGAVVLSSHHTDQLYVNHFSAIGETRYKPNDNGRELLKLAGLNMRPDLTIILNASPREIYRSHMPIVKPDDGDLAYCAIIKREFEQIAKEEPQRVKVINASSRPEDDVYEETRAMVTNAIREHGLQPIAA